MLYNGVVFVFSRYIEDLYPPQWWRPQPLTDMYDRISINYNTPYAEYLRRHPYSDYMRSVMIQPPLSTSPRKRIIYYAYLPEVVRNQPVFRRPI